MFQRLKIISTMLIACVGAVSAQSYAASDSLQRNNFAVAASFDVNIPSGSHGTWTTGSGATLGGRYAYRFSDRLFAATGLDVFYRTLGTQYMIADNSLFEGTVRNVGLRIPLMIGYSFDLSRQVAMSIATGPGLEVNLYARESAMPDFNGNTAVSTGTVNMFNRGFKRVDAIWGIALGFTFAGHYYCGITASAAFTPLAKFGNRDNKLRVRSHTIAVKLSYKF